MKEGFAPVGEYEAVHLEVSLSDGPIRNQRHLPWDSWEIRSLRSDEARRSNRSDGNADTNSHRCRLVVRPLRVVMQSPRLWKVAAAKAVRSKA